ncbi:MAG: type II toxin-antitoxin system ParD family antitoxin [Caulobacteraceae bacterium]
MSVTLGELTEAVDNRVRSGAYASASEVVRAGLRALEREEAVLTEWIKQRVEETLANPAPSIPAEDVIAELRALHAQRFGEDV